eukprot:CFRG3241T1
MDSSDSIDENIHAQKALTEICQLALGSVYEKNAVDPNVVEQIPSTMISQHEENSAHKNHLNEEDLTLRIDVLLQKASNLTLQMRNLHTEIELTRKQQFQRHDQLRQMFYSTRKEKSCISRKSLESSSVTSMNEYGSSAFVNAKCSERATKRRSGSEIHTDDIHDHDESTTEVDHLVSSKNQRITHTQQNSVVLTEPPSTTHNKRQKMNSDKDDMMEGDNRTAEAQFACIDDVRLEIDFVCVQTTGEDCIHGQRIEKSASANAVDLDFTQSKPVTHSCDSAGNDNYSVPWVKATSKNIKEKLSLNNSLSLDNFAVGVSRHEDQCAEKYISMQTDNDDLVDVEQIKYEHENVQVTESGYEPAARIYSNDIKINKGTDESVSTEDNENDVACIQLDGNGCLRTQVEDTCLGMQVDEAVGVRVSNMKCTLSSDLLSKDRIDLKHVESSKHVVELNGHSKVLLCPCDGVLMTDEAETVVACTDVRTDDTRSVNEHSITDDYMHAKVDVAEVGIASQSHAVCDSVEGKEGANTCVNVKIADKDGIHSVQMVGNKIRTLSTVNDSSVTNAVVRVKDTCMLNLKENAIESEETHSIPKVQRTATLRRTREVNAFTPKHTTAADFGSDCRNEIDKIVSDVSSTHHALKNVSKNQSDKTRNVIVHVSRTESSENDCENWNKNSTTSRADRIRSSKSDSAHLNIGEAVDMDRGVGSNVDGKIIESVSTPTAKRIIRATTVHAHSSKVKAVNMNFSENEVVKEDASEVDESSNVPNTEVCMLRDQHASTPLRMVPARKRNRKSRKGQSITTGVDSIAIGMDNMNRSDMEENSSNDSANVQKTPDDGVENANKHVSLPKRKEVPMSKQAENAFMSTCEDDESDSAEQEKGCDSADTDSDYMPTPSTRSKKRRGKTQTPVCSVKTKRMSTVDFGGGKQGRIKTLDGASIVDKRNILTQRRRTFSKQRENVDENGTANGTSGSSSCPKIAPKTPIAPTPTPRKKRKLTKTYSLLEPDANVIPRSPSHFIRNLTHLR